MDIRKTSLERAFELARLGKFERLSTLVQQLNAEGYKGDQVEGRTLRKQLIGISREARKPAAPG